MRGPLHIEQESPLTDIMDGFMLTVDQTGLILDISEQVHTLLGHYRVLNLHLKHSEYENSGLVFGDANYFSELNYQETN